MNTSDLLGQLLQAAIKPQGGSAAPQGGAGGLGGLGGLLGGLLRGGGAGGSTSGSGGLGDLLGGLGGMLGGAPAGGSTPTRSGASNYAALASLGMMAFQAYQAWQQQQASAPQQALQTVDQLSGADVEAHSHAVLCALIAAAKVDGRIDEKEQALISQELGRHTDDPDLQQWLDAQVAKPLDVSDFAEYASDPAVAAEVYLASVLLVDDQQEAERDYLDELAGVLGIKPELQLHLEQQAKPA
ncbi:tellurite resistance TerB family protein [Pseudomonas gessardii]|uniref:tellurite resistance TerB family protein n=1 Tax=Pseudomonas gessardii TaxID=78544 RepID=UPI001475E601|nr:tellurite resistance TerB family protein [Pseudomonas gessardii]MBH3425103.1 tellurite resistance TerB family protein [Pseudomonas gessardii]NNA69248.1 tellurite resistance TerB family protein [Pseudomonas gessardii]